MKRKTKCPKEMGGLRVTINKTFFKETLLETPTNRQKNRVISFQSVYDN